MVNENVSLGKRIKEARLAKNLTLKELGKLVGISESNMQKHESGNIKGISTKRLKLLSQVLNVKTNWLMNWQEEESTKKIIEVTEFTDDEMMQIKQYMKFLLSQRKDI